MSGKALNDAEFASAAGQKAATRKQKTEPQTKGNPSPARQENVTFSPFSGIDWRNHMGSRYADTPPPSIDWLLKETLPRGIAGVVAAVGGAGKSTATIQAAIEMSAGLTTLGIWEPVKPLRVLFISAEDSETILHKRIHYRINKLPEQNRSIANENLCAIPLRGDVSIIIDGKNGIQKTRAYYELEELIKSFRPDIVIADTYSRFVSVDDKDNPKNTRAIMTIEELCDYGCSFLFIHHVNKGVQYVVNTKEDLSKALDPHSIRGASAIVDSCRLAILLAPLGKKLASEIIDSDARFYKDLSYVAIKAAKKNYGPPEDTFFLKRGEHGLFNRVIPVVSMDETNELGDIEKLVEAVREREVSNLPPLAASSAGATLFSWSNRKTAQVVQAAEAAGLLKLVKNPKGNGNVLRCM